MGSYAAPTFADIDGDGDLDAFVGNKDGNTRYYQNTGTASSPSFAAALTNPFNLTDVGSVARPALADIDGDGDLDAFVGNNDGNTLYFENTSAVANQPPVAVDDAVSTDENTAVNGNVLTNDTDPDTGDILTVSAVNGNAANVGNQITLLSGALLTLNANGTFAYNPNAQFESLAVGATANDSFTYTITDGSLTSTATVNLTINGVNDAPVAGDDSASANKNTPLTLLATNLLANDTDVDSSTLSITAVSNAVNGSVTLNGSGNVVFTPTAGFTGNGSFNYTLSDGNGGTDVATVTVAVGVNLNGTNNNDNLNGTSGNDIINGLNAQDTISGNAGNDCLVGDNGDDKLYGGTGNDNLYGGNGQDTLNGDAGNDRLEGDNGDDKLYGGDGNDSLLGGNGQDLLVGGALNDFLKGDLGDDNLTGGTGSDIFVLQKSAGRDTFTDFSLGEGDKIGLSGLSFSQLSFSGNQISLGNQTLAVLSGFNTTTLTQSNFVSV